MILDLPLIMLALSIVGFLVFFNHKRKRLPTTDEFFAFSFDIVTFLGGFILFVYVVTGTIFIEPLKEDVKTILLITSLAVMFMTLKKLYDSTKFKSNST